MNFGGNEVVYGYSESEIVILPVPYDETSTWMRGADKGPDAIIEASANLEFYDIETASEVHLKGINTVKPVLEKETPVTLVNAVYGRTLSLLSDKKFPVILGGNHTVTIGAIKAFAEYFIDYKTWTLNTHLDRYGNSISKVVLYGHNVECAWLIWDAVDAINDEALIDYWKLIVLSLIKSVITDGLDDNGKLIEGYDKISGLPMTASIWWVQAEALNGFLLAEELDPDKNYLKYFISLWNHIKTKHIDKRHGEWFWYSRDDMAKGMSNSLVNEWKGPYHNGRAMLKTFQYFSKKTEEI